MTPKPDIISVQKSIYDFLEDFERKRSEEFPPLISIYKKKNDAGENDNVDSHDVEKIKQSSHASLKSLNIYFFAVWLW